MESQDSRAICRTTCEKTSLFLVAVALHALEFFLPRVPFLPWLKPGLANMVTIVWVVRYGFGDALLYSFLRIWISGFFFGFSIVTLALSLSGALLACCAIAACRRAFGKRNMLGAVGISIMGALCHNLGQLAAVYLLMAPNLRLLYQIPPMLIASVIFGGCVGMLVPHFYRIWRAAARATDHREVVDNLSDFSGTHLSLSVFILTLCASLAFVENMRFLGIAAAAMTLGVQVTERGSLRALFHPFTRFWLLFLFIACIHLLLTYGTRMESVPWITHEGAQLTARQWLRLWTWLQATFVFARVRLHAVSLAGLRRIFPNNRDTLYSALLAMQCFPDVAAAVKAKSGMLLRTMFRRPTEAMSAIINDTIDLAAGRSAEDR